MSRIARSTSRRSFSAAAAFAAVGAPSRSATSRLRRSDSATIATSASGSISEKVMPSGSSIASVG